MACLTLPPYAAPRRRYPLHVYIAVLFSTLVLSTGILIAGLDYANARRLALDAVGDLFERSTRETLAELRASHEPIRILVALLAQSRQTASGGPAGALDNILLIRQALDSAPLLSSFHIGFADGGLFSISRLDVAATRRTYKAPAESAYVVRTSTANGWESSLRFYDEAMNLIERRTEQPLDPRHLGWYRAGMAHPGLVRTAAFALASHDIGFAIVQATPDRQAVVSADLALKDLSASLSRQRPSPSAQLALLDADQKVLAASQGSWMNVDDGHVEPPTLEAMEIPILLRALAEAPASGRVHTLKFEGRKWETLAATYPIADGPPLKLVMAAPHDELLQGVVSLSQQALLSLLGLIVLAVPITWWIARRISLDLRGLAADARAIRRFDFTDRPVGSFVLEVDDLAKSMTGMRATIRQFLAIASRLSAERNFQHLLDGLIDKTADAARAEAGAVYLVDSDGMALSPAAWKNVDLSHLLSPPAAIAIADDAEPHPLRDTYREAAMRADRLEAGNLPKGLGWIATRFPGQSVSCLTVPLISREGRIIGVLFLSKSATLESFSAEQASFVNALAGPLAVAIDNQRLIKAQKDLLDSIIRVMAGAIDAKSPHTGGHCQRVPEFALMLAEAACQSTDGPFRDFSLTDDEWETLSIAAWLHDCGKLTTPEFVVDKATKLETLYDRIHEIRTRFEVLKRDAEIRYWQGLASGGEATALVAARDAELAALDADFAFVASCNVGGETLADGVPERLQRIGRRTWRRTLDDRLGISTTERLRKERLPAVSLPVEEPLLADRDDHRTVAKAGAPLPPDIHFQPPKHQLDLGELHCLSVARGTLTEEERFLINNHIVQSIIMLRDLPFPDYLKGVPEVAGNHHEHLDGSGYPRGLTADALSPLARMMVIADIFEALTAADRPYKPGKRLSEAMALLADRVRQGHLDRNLFELLLESGVHLRYAERFLDPAQIDTVDIAAIRQRAGITP